MFTGLVEAVGRVKSVQNKDGGRGIRINVNGLGTDFVPEISESVSINGVCLTVTKLTGNDFEVYASGSTLSATNLSLLRVGQSVNLERALRLSSRLGGHIVQGHVDGVGKVTEKRMRGKSVLLTIRVLPEMAKYIINNGSIAIDGVSLTVKEIRGSNLKINLIPYTLDNTTLKDLRAGSSVNIETDVLGKYLRK